MSGGFQTFGVPHLAALGVIALVAVALIALVRRGPAPVRDAVRYGLAGTLLLNEFAWWSVRVVQLGLDGFLRNHLPFHLCGVAVFLTAITLVRGSRGAYEIAWFWGVAGAGIALITPGNMDAGFPQYRFFQYFVAHGGIVTGMLVATFGLGMRPTGRALVKAFAWLHVMAVPVALANLALDANYMYLCAPPTGTVNPFFFLPWPWYLPVLEVVGLVAFALVAAPFLVRRPR